MTITELIQELIKEGGAIVSSNDCSEIEISNAQSTGRFAIDEGGLGFIRRTSEWLDLQKEREEKHIQIRRILVGF